MKTHKVLTLILEDGKNEMAEIDMIFQSGKPFAVFEYKSFSDNRELPTILVPLDPALLQPATLPSADYFYGGQIVIPKPEDN